MAWYSSFFFFYEYAYFSYIRPLWQWLIYLYTGKPEIVRLVEQAYEPASLKPYYAEFILNRTRCSQLAIMSGEVVTCSKAVDDIIAHEQINLQTFPRFKKQLSECLAQVIGYRQLVAEVERLRGTPYSSTNDEHEKLLMQLWSLLRPSEALQSRISSQWSEIGFQGDDPMTDFRGMGILSLHNLIFLASHHTDVARQLLSHSHHPQLGYSLAITGINITFMSVQLLRPGHLKTHFYNAVRGPPTLDDYHRVFCFLLFEFDKFWFAEKPRDIMEFNIVRERFYRRTAALLEDRSTVLRFDFT